MSTPFYDLASLVVVPSGYKSGKVYAQKPLTTDGQLTFTRASSATRVASNGLIEKVRTNLNTYSQNFSATGGWAALFGATITPTANYGTAPDGTTTSTRIVFSGANQIYSKTISGLTGNIGVFSLWIKGTAGQTITITYGGASDKLVTLGTGWNRFNTNGNLAAGNTIYINTFLSATALDIEVWGGQVELGDIATDYIPTTTAAVSVGPVSGLPRLDYLNSTCPKLLLEPQRTNLLNFSEQFNNVYWDKDVGITVNANAAGSPDGNINADRINFASSNQAIYKLITATGAHRFSIYLKGEGANIGKQIQLELPVSINVTLTGDWQRFVGNADNAGSVAIKRISAGQADSVLAYGAQLEAGAYATSYIPTLSASVTRVADAASKTGISSLIGQTEGVMFVDINRNYITSSYDRYFAVDDADATIYRTGIYLFPEPSIDGRIYLSIRNNNTAIYEYTYNNTTMARLKIAMAYKSGDIAYYINGAQVATSSATFTFAHTLSRVLSSGVGQSVNQTLLFNTRLTNAQLAELTTL